MTRRALLTALALLAAVPATAPASPERIFEDCQDGRLDRRYSDRDLRQAIKRMPPDLDEYTNCRELIRSAQLGVRGGGGSGPGSNFNGAEGYGALPAGEGGLPLGPDSRPVDPVGIAAPEERAEVERARSGLTGVKPDDHGAALPLPLIVLLVLVAAGSLAVLVPRLRELVLRRAA